MTNDEYESYLADPLNRAFVQELERRAEPTLDELLARARERFGWPFVLVITPKTDGSHLVDLLRGLNDSFDGIGYGALADATADTAMGALRVAVEGR